MGRGIGFTHILYQPMPGTLKADLNGDHTVNFGDFSVLAGEWLQMEEWYVPLGDDPTACTVDCPVMSITSTRSEVDADPGIPGLESLFQYSVENTSAQGEQYNMIDFTLPTGTDQGVFYIGHLLVGHILLIQITFFLKDCLNQGKHSLLIFIPLT